MPYIINRYNGTQLLVLQDGTIDTTTSLGLLGRNYTGYGEVQNENFIFLLENFASNNPPPRPISGQTWYSTLTKTLNIYDGQNWKSVGSAVTNSTPPVDANGALWFDTDTKQLYVFNDGWNLIGIEAVEGFGATRTKATTLRDTLNNLHPVLQVLADDEIIAIISKDEFSIAVEDSIFGFPIIRKGINISTLSKVHGNLEGTATAATRLAQTIQLNGTPFDGQTSVTLSATTFGTLTPGTYINGSAFNGATSGTWNINATSNNTIGAIVARDSSGDFSAGNITANLIGNVTGNITSSGISYFNEVQATTFVGATLTGNAFSATKLQTERTINGIGFDGSANITVPAAAGTLTGNTINSTVIYSNLSSVGELNSLKVRDGGIVVGDNNLLKIFTDTSENPVIRSQIAGKSLELQVNDSTQINGFSKLRFVPTDVSLSLGGSANPSILPAFTNTINLGSSLQKFNNVYSNFLIGTATTAQYADLAEKYLADAQYEPGTVLEFGGEFEVTVAEDETRRVAGIVSSNPAYEMNSNLQGKFVVSLALQGRVPCKVRGKIRKGDMLVSGGSGYARPTNDPKIGTIIGKSLEDFEGNEGFIEVVVGRL